MARMAFQRIALGLLTLWLVSVLIFAGTEILPGDVATAILGQSRTPEAVAAIRASLDLDRPAYLRYATWLFDFAKGDPGTSLVNGRSITEELSGRLKNTLFLAGATAAVAVPLSILLGLLAAINSGGILDRVINSLALTAISVPEFMIGYVLIIVFSVRLGWFPSLATISDDMGFWERVHAITLPVATLVAVVLAHMMRQTRAALLSVLSNPYIETAILKGISKWRIVIAHALPNAVAPILNVVAINLAYLIVGVVVVEVVFVYPGMGQLMVDSVSKRDVPVVQTCGLTFALVYIGLNLAADLAGIASNPRLRRPR